jgi:hypothetical protein
MADFFEKYPFSGYKVPEKNMGSSGFYLYNEEEKQFLFINPPAIMPVIWGQDKRVFSKGVYQKNRCGIIP